MGDRLCSLPAMSRRAWLVPPHPAAARWAGHAGTTLRQAAAARPGSRSARQLPRAAPRGEQEIAREAPGPGRPSKAGRGLNATTGLASLATLALLGQNFELSGPASVLEAVAVLAGIVIVHECGHFFAARVQGIRVSRFSIGFGPALWKYQGKEVEYSLSAIPLGGYVAFPDDEPPPPPPPSEAGKKGAGAAAATAAAAPAAPAFDPDDPDLMKNRSIAARGFVISAGVMANILCAYLVLFAQVVAVGKTDLQFLPGVVAPNVNPSSVAARSGLKSGDVITMVGAFQVPAGPSQVKDVVDRIKESPERELLLTLERAGAQLQLPVVPELAPDGSGRLGLQLSTRYTLRHTKVEGLGEAATYAASEFARIWGQVAGGLWQVFTNFGAMASQLSGPVAIVAAGSRIAQVDSSGLLQFAAALNINLALVNILPLPGLDGAYLLLLLVEAARGGRKLPKSLEQGVMNGGFVLLLMAGAGLVIRDTINLF